MSPAIDRSALLARLLSLDSLDTLESFLLETPAATRRRDLWQLFLSRCEYQHAGEWAEAVRICEALTIVGWGSREQVDAVCELWENGWHTYFVNAQSEYRFREATWTKRQAGFTQWNPSYHASPDRPTHPDVDWQTYGRTDRGTTRVVSQEALPTQRNRRRLSPLLIGGIHGTGKTAALVQGLSGELKQVLRPRIRPDAYGDGLQCFDFCLVTWSGQGKLKSQLKLGRYPPKSQLYRCYLEFAPDFHRLSRAEQLDFLSTQLLAAVDHAASCLRKQGVAYDVASFRQDVAAGLQHWKTLPAPAVSPE